MTLHDMSNRASNCYETSYIFTQFDTTIVLNLLSHLDSPGDNSLADENGHF